MRKVEGLNPTIRATGIDRSPRYPGQVRRGLCLSISVLLVGVLFSPAANAALYRGGGSGLRVEFRVVGHKIVEAKVVARLRCIDGYGKESERRYRRVRLDLASKRFPIRTDRAGRFQEPKPGEPEGAEEPGYFSDELIKGRVRSARVVGRFAYLQVYNTRHRSEVCRTGSFNRAWYLRSKDEVSFRAPRRHPGH